MSTRDAFETWWVSMPADERPDYKVAWLVWKAAALAQPDDWVLVPREPTPEMIEAYLTENKAYWEGVDQLAPKLGTWRAGTPKEATKFGYIAMIAAAPKEPK